MPLARFKELAELVVTADDNATAGQRSGGAMRSSAKANRSNRRKSPYAVAAATPTAPSGISPALAALGMGSVTRRRSTKFRAAVLVPEPAQLVVPVMHGAGGARGACEKTPPPPPNEPPAWRSTLREDLTMRERHPERANSIDLFV
jgi:hypothetical protein